MLARLFHSETTSSLLQGSKFGYGQPCQRLVLQCKKNLTKHILDAKVNKLMNISFTYHKFFKKPMAIFRVSIRIGIIHIF